MAESRTRLSSRVCGCRPARLLVCVRVCVCVLLHLTLCMKEISPHGRTASLIWKQPGFYPLRFGSDVLGPRAGGRNAHSRRDSPVLPLGDARACKTYRARAGARHPSEAIPDYRLLLDRADWKRPVLSPRYLDLALQSSRPNKQLGDFAPPVGCGLPGSKLPD